VPGVIVSFGDKFTADLYHGERRRSVRRFPSDVRKVAMRKLDALNGASDLNDLRSPPGNRLETLRGDRFGHHSIRVNDRWRLVFRWADGNAHDVSLVDYH
jgi:proteic killer suppression protein